MTRKHKNIEQKAHPNDVEQYKMKSPEAYSTYSYDKYIPNEVGTYSKNNVGEVVNCNATEFPQLISDSHKFPVDLSIGLEDFIEEERIIEEIVQLRNEKLSILHWICETNYNLEVEEVDIITNRGIFKKMGHTLYDRRREPWCFKFCKYHGRLYITEEKKVEVEDYYNTRFSGMGRKFEKYVTSSVGSDMYGCYSIVRASLGRYRVLMNAEMDAVRPKVVDPVEAEGAETADNQYEYIEIKTCFEESVTKKLPAAWLQSHLAGIETLYFGFRSWDGIVSTTKEYKVSEIPFSSSWDGGAMFGLMSGIINWVYNKLEDGTSCTLRYCGKGNDVVLTRDGGHFLPTWYVYHVDNIDYLDYVDDIDDVDDVDDVE